MAELPTPKAKSEPVLAQNKAILEARKKKAKKAGVRPAKDLPIRREPSKLTEDAIERGVAHMDIDNPELWDGGICED